MKQRVSVFYTIIASLAMLILIIDSRTALSGASSGVILCLTTIIPSLFPFIVISNILTGLLSVHRITVLRPVGRFLHLPENTETLLLIGFLGGYPIGAQCIVQSYRNGNLSRSQAERMLSFCNNAGPSFLFGIGAAVLQKTWPCWILWLIHISSALIVGLMTPPESEHHVSMIHSSPISVTDSVNKAIRTMASICGWVVIFRTLLIFFQRWIFWIMPDAAKCLISGILELANGCTSLSSISSIGLRFQLFSVMLGFGGLCVALQTHSVLTGSGLSVRTYFPGKMAQSAVSYLLCVIIQPLLPETLQHRPNIAAIAISFGICVCYRVYRQIVKKDYSFPTLVGV